MPSAKPDTVGPANIHGPSLKSQRKQGVAPAHDLSSGCCSGLKLSLPGASCAPLHPTARRLPADVSTAARLHSERNASLFDHLRLPPRGREGADAGFALPRPALLPPEHPGAAVNRIGRQSMQKAFHVLKNASSHRHPAFAPPFTVMVHLLQARRDSDDRFYVSRHLRSRQRSAGAALRRARIPRKSMLYGTSLSVL